MITRFYMEACVAFLHLFLLCFQHHGQHFAVTKLVFCLKRDNQKYPLSRNRVKMLRQLLLLYCSFGLITFPLK